MNVLLGYAMGSGEPVNIPISHMVVTGQTQAAGKTTALEALIERSGARAVCFVTKRGEGSFSGARRVDPYFREQADWQFVAAILEASRGERLKYERSWIIRASRGARTLSEVQRNVRNELKKARGANESAYICLDAYLEVVVPQIAQVAWATSVALAEGINAMDLEGLAGEMQQLVIRSTIDWVLQKEKGTIVVVPEAWKFIPQGRGTPVKMGAEAYVRQGAGLKNFLWLDSQDIAGVDKTILKNIPLWVLGVQRESNEIKRTLDQIPAGVKKPKPEHIATLSLGEFFACWGTNVVRTYVRPAWMTEADAIGIARGRLDISNAPKPKAKEKPTVDQITEDRLNSMERNIVGAIKSLAAPAVVPGARVGFGTPAPSVPTPVPSNAPPDTDGRPFSSETKEAIYQEFKARLMAEAPAVIQLLASQPEISIKVERRTIETDQTSMMGMLATLLYEGYFDKAPVKSGTAHKETQRRWGYGGAPVRTYEKMEELLSLGFVTKEADGYLAAPNIQGRIRTS